ncbi:helix-turn-helix domain-containing protein [Streptomyces sp. SBT349]|uniref:helix-turn-helix domain-containing protein n=1 Tax=Streptomyces sp. SBT349 TaxID=1580539 RepID=UPI00066B6B2E|nr:helix-turn-helix domain-containing protein [Streptomyces sp. SBT349]
MKGLLLRLSSLDADAAAALRVIAHFQALLSGGSLEPVVLARSTAGLAQCPAGLELADGRTARFAPDGIALPGVPGHVSAAVDLRPTGRVWLERDGGPGPLDDLVLEWMAIAAGMGPHRDARSPRVADPALVETVLSEREAVEDRARALRLLGLNPELPLRVVAVAGGEGTDAGVEAVALLARGGPRTAAVRVAAVGALAAVLVQPGAGTDSPARELRQAMAERIHERGPGGERRRGVRLGVGGSVAPTRARVSWGQARAALRFAVANGGPAEAVVDHDALGPLSLLAEVPVARLRAEPGVRALAELAGRDGGELSIAALAAFCETGSLRRAATALHLHHSSVAARLAGAEAALGWRLRDPDDRFRAQLALYAWRLSAAA